VHRLDFVEHHAAEERAKAGHGVQQRQRVGVRVLGGFEEGECDLAKQRLGIVEARELDCEPLGPSRSSKARGAPLTGGFIGHLLAERRQMILAGGLLDVGQALGPLACERPPAPEQVAGRPPGGRIDRGLRAHPTAQPHGKFVGIERVIVGRAPMAGLHGEGMTEHEGHPLLRTEISQPIPGEQTFDTDDDSRAIGRDGLEERFWRGWHVTVHQNLPSLVQEAAGHRAGVPVDATIKLVRLGVKSPEVSSS
jgi:hypothetical protein